MIRWFLFAFVVMFTLSGCGGENGIDDGSGTVAERGPLKPGGSFPDVGLVDLDGNPVRSTDLLGDGDALVFFVALGCESCREVSDVWREMADKVPPSLAVFAIAGEEPEFAKRYMEKHPYPFPLYCDEQGIFDSEYKMQAFPSAVAIPADRRIAFVGTGVNKKFTPMRAMEIMEQVKSARRGS